MDITCISNKIVHHNNVKMSPQISTSKRQKYMFTSQYRPDELLITGSGDYCCIPGCTSTTYDHYQNKTLIGFFTFPTNPAMWNLWFGIISQFRRMKTEDVYNNNNNNELAKMPTTLKVCEFHFAIEDIKCSHFGAKSLRAGAFPKIFKFNPIQVGRFLD